MKQKKLLNLVLIMIVVLAIIISAIYILKTSNSKTTLIQNEIEVDNNQSSDIYTDTNNSLVPNNKVLVENYIKDNISTLSSEPAVLGGNFYVTSIAFTGPYSGIVDYEDGHIALRALFDFKIVGEGVKIENFQILPSREEKANFSKIGNLIEKDSGWQLVYEEPGKPALNVNLNFDQSSQCFLDSEPRLCEPVFWQLGNRAQISGLGSGDEVLVYSLNIVLEN